MLAHSLIGHSIYFARQRLASSLALLIIIIIIGNIENANRSRQSQDTVVSSSPSHSPSLPKMCYAFSRYRKYLHSYYNRNPIVRDDKLSIAPCSQFINLALVKKDEQINSFTKTTLHGGVDEINKSKIPVGMDAIVTSDSQFVLAEGPPGIGKSTLCWELCRQWDTLKSLKDYKIVLQLKLRERRVQNASSLQEIFYNRDSELSQNVVKEVSRCEGEGVLLILDGFDEMPSSIVQDKDSLLMELISGTSLPKATRLVTSRPSALHHKEKCFPQKFRHIEILGFTSDESKVRYAKLAFDSEPEVLASFKKFVFSNPIIKSLMYIPVNCAIISQVYKDIRRSRKLMPKTMTQLYSTLIPVLIKRYMIEKGKWDSHHGIPSDLEDLPKEFILSLNRVSELAYNGLIKNDIQLVFTDSDVGEGFQHLGLLSETKEMYVCEGAVSSYSFVHLSIQEFLAAWHVKCHPELKVSLNTLFINAKSSRHIPNQIGYLTTFGYFIAGMIGYEFISTIDKFKDMLFLVMCMYEAQDCSQLTSSRCLSITPSNPMEMYAFGYVLVHAPIKWHLSNTRVPPFFDILASSLTDHAASSIDQIQGSIVGLRIEYEYVDLRLPLLPKCLLHSIITMSCCFRGGVTPSRSVVLKWLPNLINMQNISISFQNNFLQDDDYLLYEMLRHFPIKDLNLCFEYITYKGIQELSTFLSSSNTIKKVRLDIYHYDHMHSDFSLSRLIEAALSCSTVISLRTNIPFHILHVPTHHHLKTMIFDTSLTDYPEEILPCLLNIAELCKEKHMKILRVHDQDTIPPEDYVDFLCVLNDSLHQNPSMRQLDIPSLPSFPKFKLEEFPHIVRKVHANVRRTKSLSDIATAIPLQPPNLVQQWQYDWRVDYDDRMGYFYAHLSKKFEDIQTEYNDGFQHIRSCENLLTLYDHVHPLLYKALFPKIN